MAICTHFSSGLAETELSKNIDQNSNLFAQAGDDLNSGTTVHARCMYFNGAWRGAAAILDYRHGEEITLSHNVKHMEKLSLELFGFVNYLTSRIVCHPGYIWCCPLMARILDALY